jgi:peptide/nickel transport system substrate-binding protein
MTDTSDVDQAAAAAGLTREELLRRAVAGGGAVLLAGNLAGVARAAVDAAPKRGGTFRVGVSGGSAKDFIDGQNIVTRPDQARIVTGWETLVVFDSNFKLRFDGLAEEIVPNKAADQWTIRVRKGIEFQNGKTLSADDVKYSLQRLVNKKLGLFGGAALSSVDPARIQKLDKRTVRLHLKQRDGTILDALGQYVAGIVPVGYSPNAVGQAKPNVGTGPYMVQSFTPGQQSVHVRNPNYWRSGQPYFDKVIVIDFPDDTARVNALPAARWTRSPTCRRRRLPSSTATRARRCSSRRAPHGHRSACGSTQSRSPTFVSARRCG